MADVTDLGKERRKRKKKADAFKPTEFAYNIVQKMNRHPLSPREWPDFPETFHIFRDEAGRLAVLEETANRVVSYRDEGLVISAIARYCWEHLGGMMGADLSHKGAIACAKLWLDLTPPLAERPLALAELSTPGLAFRRLPFDAPPREGLESAPCFAEFLSRCTQSEAVAAFIGSLFYPNADRQQYLYFYGEGNDGKGALLGMLFRLLGSASTFLTPKKGDDKFWNFKTYAKRLVAFADCDDFKVFSSAEFKSLTGNDPIYFEEKGRMGFTDIPTCKIIAASNHRPNITSQRSDLRRLIYVEVGAVPAELVTHYETQLLAEAEVTVAHCKAVYERLSPGHGPVPCAPAAEVAFEAESDALTVFNRYFLATGDKMHTISGSQVREILQKENVKNGAEQKAMREIWRRQLGIGFKHGNKGTIYFCMRMRSSADSFDVCYGSDE